MSVPVNLVQEFVLLNSVTITVVHLTLFMYTEYLEEGDIIISSKNFIFWCYVICKSDDYKNLSQKFV